jgi:hypothetical protein
MLDKRYWSALSEAKEAIPVSITAARVPTFATHLLSR